MRAIEASPHALASSVIGITAVRPSASTRTAAGRIRPFVAALHTSDQARDWKNVAVGSLAQAMSHSSAVAGRASRSILGP